MRNHIKKDREYFVNEVNEILKAKTTFSAGNNAGVRIYRVSCKGTSLKITVYPENDHKTYIACLRCSIIRKQI